MNRGVYILLTTVILSVAAYFGYYHLAMHPTKAMLAQPQSELAWLRDEYHLTDAHFAKIEQLHREYRPLCDQMCVRIASANARANALIPASDSVTPEVEAALNECASTQKQCREAMLKHVYAVAAEMSPADRQRYIKMVAARIVEPGLDHGSVVSK